MNLDRFLRDREQAWAELDTLLHRARGRPDRLGADGIRRLGVLYRGASADLAFARRAFRGDTVVVRLEQLVVRARAVVYAAEARRTSLRSFATEGYWRRVRERPVPLLAAALLLFGPMFLAALWGHNDPAAAIGVVPGEFRSAGEARTGGTDLGLSASERTAFSVEIFVNNIQVSLAAFAGGVSAGLLTVAALLYNGLFIGALTGLAIKSGASGTFFQLVVPHGVLELSCIVVAGASGLRLGWAFVDPGRRPRGAAVVDEARAAVELVLGTAVWLVVAGLVEGYLTPTGQGPGIAYGVGIGLGALFWALVWWRGRPPAVPSTGTTDSVVPVLGT
jgi:uncharacterized membrane protein SpoIIM required for sporulation